MNDQDFELISQYLDAELDELSARRLERRLESEPELRQTLANLRALDDRLQRVFQDSDTPPPATAALLRPSAEALATREPGRAWYYAIAASLVVAAGLLLSPAWEQSRGDRASFTALLETAPSMADGWKTLNDGRKLRPVLSFRSTDGSWCREYLVAEGHSAERGIACRDGGNWGIRIASASELPAGASEFRPAGAGDSDTIAAYLAANADGIALGPAEEQALIEAGWQQ